MKSILRAYLCTASACGMMGLELAGWAATRGRAVLLLPSTWILDPDKAPEGFRRLAADDRAILAEDSPRRRAEGEKEIRFPVMIEGELGGDWRVVRDSDWLEYVRSNEEEETTSTP